jgi:hypothetical protein
MEQDEPGHSCRVKMYLVHLVQVLYQPLSTNVNDTWRSLGEQCTYEGGDISY